MRFHYNQHIRPTGSRVLNSHPSVCHDPYRACDETLTAAIIAQDKLIELMRAGKWKKGDDDE